MRLFIRIIISAVVFISGNASLLLAQNDTADYYTENILRYEDRVYRKNIKTVVLSPDKLMPAQPIIRLEGGDKLYLDFDDLDGDHKNYSYTLVHCTYNWEPTNILTSEFLDGFIEYPITRYDFARTSLQRYTHYSISIPDDNAHILKSGNYLLKVYLNSNQEDLAFTRRFMVVDEKFSVDASVHAATIIADRNYKQEVDFTIRYSSGAVSNPFVEIKPVILQNGRWDNAIIGLQPQFLKDNELVYDYDDANVFKGSNEYRWFDTRSLRMTNERTASVTKENNLYHVYLVPDEKRTFKRYSNSQDINGRFLIKTYEGDNSDVDGDYAWVHFFLPYDAPVTGGNVYIFGQLSDWQCKPDFKMTYNKERRGYEASVFLKQGYYNYHYVYLKDNEKGADDYMFEGMSQQAENDYTILIYFRRQGSWVDELVAVKRLNSRM